MSGIGKEGDTAEEWILVKGARTHNLRNVDVNLPRGKFVVINVVGYMRSGRTANICKCRGRKRCGAIGEGCAYLLGRWIGIGLVLGRLLGGLV